MPHWGFSMSVVRGQVFIKNPSCLISEQKALLTTYVVIWVKSKLSCLIMCPLVP